MMMVMMMMMMTTMMTMLIITIMPVSHGSAYTVVRVTQQVNDKGQFWGCQNSVTPEPID